MRDVKMIKHNKSTIEQKNCLNYAGCKGMLGAKEAGRKRRIALTMRDVKSYKLLFL